MRNRETYEKEPFKIFGAAIFLSLHVQQLILLLLQGM